jgi:hypothetical protein
MKTPYCWVRESDNDPFQVLSTPVRLPPLLLRAAKVGLLDRGDLFIVEWDWRTAVPLFTDKVKLRRWLVAT